MNLLIFESNKIECKNIINEIANLKIRVNIKLAYSGSESIEILKNTKIDIIILNLDRKNKLLEFIQNNNSNELINSVIGMVSNRSIIKQYKNNEFINSFANNCYEVVETVNSLVKQKVKLRQKIIEKINNELIYLKYNFKHIGTQYLCECIFEIYVHPQNTNLTLDIYPILAKKYNTTENNIKCNIFQANLNSYLNCEHKKLEEYLRRPFIEKPTMRDIIYAVIKHL